MKRSNRIKLLIASTVVLAVSSLIPTVLTACSSSTDNNAGIEEKVAELSKPSNVWEQEFIYRKYIGELNKKTDTPQQVPTQNNSLGLPSLPDMSNLGVTSRLSTLVKQISFIDELINMFKTGLSASNGISQNEINDLIIEMIANKNEMIATPAAGKAGSVWADNAFAFQDNTGGNPSWTFTKPKAAGSQVVGNNEIEYNLYLPSDVEFKYEVKSDKSVGVTVINKNRPNKGNNVRLEVVSSPKLGATGIVANKKVIYFKTGAINLPTSLMSDFKTFFNHYNDNSETYIKYVNEASGKYKDIVDKNIVNAATFWNQFMLEKVDYLTEEIQRDLDKNKGNSQLINWLKVNTTSSTVANQLASDLNAATNINVNVSQILMQGNGVNESITSPANRIQIDFNAAKATALNQKVYSIDLYPTSFTFTSKVNKFFGFTSEPSLSCTPSLTLGGSSQIACYTMNGSTPSIQGSDKFKSGSSINVFNTLEYMFSEFLSELLAFGPSGPTIDLLTKQQDDKTDFIDLFKEYLHTIGHNKIKNDVSILPELIFNNINLSSMAYTTEAVQPEFNEKHKNIWKPELQRWLLQTGSESQSNRPTITVSSASGNETQ